METTHSRLDQLYKFAVTLALVIAALVLLKEIIVPMVFAALFSVVLLPFAKRIEKKIGRISSIIVLLLVSLVFLAMVAWLVVAQLSNLVQSLPTLETKFYSLMTLMSESLDKQFSISSDEQVALIKDGVKNLSNYASDFLFSTSYLVYFFIQVPIYIFLFLYYRDRFNDFVHVLNPTTTLAWKDEIQKVVRGYISGLAIVVFIAGVLNSVGLLLLGIENAIFFGFLSGTLTMIPYVGIAIGAALPALLALATKDSAWYAVGVIAVHGFVQFLEGNFITPKVTGSLISIHALAAVVALLLAGKIWGIAGMILSVPSVGILKIVMNYSATLKPLVVLLGDEPTGEERPTPPAGEQRM